jgi:hypothetical protein
MCFNAGASGCQTPCICINLSAKAGYAITSSAIASTLAGNSRPSEFTDQGKASTRCKGDIKGDMTAISATC